MINKISLNPNYLKLNQPTQPVAVEKPAFKSSLKQEKLQELNGLDTQAIYMSVSIQQAPTSMNDLEMPTLQKISDETDMNKIEGKPIYNSNGELVSVVVENNYSKAVYKADSEYPDKVGSIELFEKASGKKISSQENLYDKNGNLEEVQVRMIEKTLTGEYYQETDYNNNGKIVYQNKAIEYPDESYKSISKYRDGRYAVNQVSKDGKTSYFNSYAKDQTIESVEYSKVSDSSTRSKIIRFYNGVAYSIKETKLTLEPKLTADKLIDKSLFVPSERSDISFVDKQHLLAEVLVNEDIKKKYYSDGSLEAIQVDGETLSFSEDGEIISAKYDGKSVQFNIFSEIIEETQEDGTIKTTEYYKDGGVRVALQDGDKLKILTYTPKGTVRYYEEKTLLENGEYQQDVDLNFNDAEILEASY